MRENTPSHDPRELFAFLQETNILAMNWRSKSPDITLQQTIPNLISGMTRYYYSVYDHYPICTSNVFLLS